MFEDPVAQKLVEQIEYDYSKFDTARMSEIGCAIRCWFFDQKVIDFVKSHVNPIIVNVGCGLDARCQRTVGKDNRVCFYSLDLPETINLRKRFLPEDGAEKYISSSMFETVWMDDIKKLHPTGSFLFIIEVGNLGLVLFIRAYGRQ